MLGLDHQIASFCHAVIQARIDSGGLDVRYRDSVVLFYAGPSGLVVSVLCAQNPSTTSEDYVLNWVVADQEAVRLNAQRIDDTAIFDYLMSLQFKKDFIAATGISDRQFVNEKKKVWDYVSARFARTDFREAATLVCGASADSSFYREEMLGMLEGEHLKIVNDRPANLFRDFRSLGQQEVHRLMAITYLLNLRAHLKNHPDDEAVRQLYHNQRRYFVVSRQPEKQTFATQDVSVRLAFRASRREILAHQQADDIPSCPANPAPVVATHLMMHEV